MITLIITLLLNLGLLNSAADWDTLSSTEQQNLTEVVIDDVDFE